MNTLNTTEFVKFVKNNLNKCEKIKLLDHNSEIEFISLDEVKLILNLGLYLAFTNKTQID